MRWICKIMALFCCFNLTVKAQTKLLTNGWYFQQENSKTWYKATVPGTVHTDLLQNKLIPDPFYRDNEIKLQWISKTNWVYKTQFSISPNMLAQANLQLIFEGLDTYALVYLNEQLVLQADNMFRTWTINIKSYAKAQNQLRIVFKSAENVADSLAKKSTLLHPCENNRNYVRKAQYHFGWDFAPKLTTCGIWKKIQLKAFGQHATAAPKSPKKNISWNIQLVQQKDVIGQSFYFTVNNTPTFIKGANWVPADVFLPRVTKNKYRQLLIAAKEAGINMLRVWGGGIYESDDFYTLCDSLKIMVWQDFMFAGAMYPADSASLANIKAEVTDNLQRIAHHPCIAVWCGNNEIDEAWNNWGWQKQWHISPEDSTQLWQNYQKIFHELLPNLVKQYSAQPYITTSPTNGWGRKTSMTHGDSHYWGVWWGMEPIATYKEKIPRFMSEYGMQAMPNYESIQQFALPADMDTSSVVMKLHQKHPTGYQNLSKYLQQEKIKTTDFQSFVIATQVLQSKAIYTAVSAHLGAQPRCMGTMVWQLNDCYPGASWSLIDYYGRKKKAYFTLQILYKYN